MLSFPIGHGQRELILGDRQTGKTAIAIDTILNQKGMQRRMRLLRYWAACFCGGKGRSRFAVRKAQWNIQLSWLQKVTTRQGLPTSLPMRRRALPNILCKRGAMCLSYTTTLHSMPKRIASCRCCFRRPPGREAFPGDIFYIHSRLLERATHLRAELGNGSLTALPIIETEAQDISAYIPTNLISITDGQIYLSPSLFELDNLYRSRRWQVGVARRRTGSTCFIIELWLGIIKLAYAQFQELETFARFGARLRSRDTTNIIEHGKRIRASLQQTGIVKTSFGARHDSQSFWR